MMKIDPEDCFMRQADRYYGLLFILSTLKFVMVGLLFVAIGDATDEIQFFVKTSFFVSVFLIPIAWLGSLIIVARTKSFRNMNLTLFMTVLALFELYFEFYLIDSIRYM